MYKKVFELRMPGYGTHLFVNENDADVVNGMHGNVGQVMEKKPIPVFDSVGAWTEHENQKIIDAAKSKLTKCELDALSIFFKKQWTQR